MVCSWRRIYRYAWLVGFMVHPWGMDMHWAVLLGRDLGRSMNPSRWGWWVQKQPGGGGMMALIRDLRLVQCIGLHGRPLLFGGSSTMTTLCRRRTDSWTVVWQHHHIPSTSTCIGRSLLTPSSFRFDRRQPLASTNVYSASGHASRLFH